MINSINFSEAFPDAVATKYWYLLEDIVGFNVIFAPVLYTALGPAWPVFCTCEPGK